MADDRKHSEAIACKVTERMALDLLRVAAYEDRSVSDWLYRLIRKELYGSILRVDEGHVQSTSVAEVNR